MRYRILHMIFALLLLLPISCKQQNEVEEPSLELSATTLSFAKEAGDKSITIMTNKDSWSAFSPQENTWITLTQEGQTLHVHAEQTTKGRIAKVLSSSMLEDYRDVSPYAKVQPKPISI